MKILAAAQGVRQAIHIRDFTFDIVRILVTLAVTQALHQTGRRVADVEGNRFSACVLDFIRDRGIRRVDRIRLRRRGQIDHALRKCELALGQTDELVCLLGIERDP